MRIKLNPSHAWQTRLEAQLNSHIIRLNMSGLIIAMVQTVYRSQAGMKQSQLVYANIPTRLHQQLAQFCERSRKGNGMGRIAHSNLFEVNSRDVKTSLNLSLIKAIRTTKSQTKYQRGNDLTEFIGELVRNMACELSSCIIVKLRSPILSWTAIQMTESQTEYYLK